MACRPRLWSAPVAAASSAPGVAEVDDRIVVEYP
jgi:hypothetical protein